MRAHAVVNPALMATPGGAPVGTTPGRVAALRAADALQRQQIEQLQAELSALEAVT